MIRNYLHCFVYNYDVFKYLVISNVFVKSYIAWKLKFCFILIIPVIFTCKITYLSPLQMCFYRTWRLQWCFVYHLAHYTKGVSMFEITWIVNEKVIAYRMYIFVARVWSMTTLLNQHWLQDTAWNNILRNKHAMEHLTFCFIDLWNHLIETILMALTTNSKFDNLLFNQSIEHIIDFC